MEWATFQFLLPAIAATLIIAGIHAYLGLHVVERGIIFRGSRCRFAQIASLVAAVWRPSAMATIRTERAGSSTYWDGVLVFTAQRPLVFWP